MFWKAKYPEKMIIEITRRCNLSCIMCNIHMSDSHGEGMTKYSDMSDDLFFKLEKVFKNLKHIIFGGVGEPLISKDIIRRIALIRKLNKKIYIEMFTNGLMLQNEDFAKKLIPLIDDLHISVNGTSSYGRIMSGSSLEQLEKTLTTIAKVRSELLDPGNFLMDFILMRDNINDIVPFARLAKKYGADRIIYKDLWVFNDYLKQQSFRHDEKLKEKIANEIRLASKEAISIYVSAFPDLETDWIPKRDTPKITSFIKRHPCYDPWTQIQVTHDGIILLCCNGITFIGNLNKNQFDEIWNGEEVNKYREGMKSRKYYSVCNNCKLITEEKKAFVRENEF